MAGLFISYARADEPVAQRLATALRERGHDVWWDRRLEGGVEYSRAIEQALDASDKVIVLWSQRSVESPWVRDEAAAGRDAGKLVPLSVDGASPPLGFRQFHTIDLKEWARNAQGVLPASVEESLQPDAGNMDQTDEASHQAPQKISFCRTPDGVTLAYSMVGTGPPLVKSANWLNHLEFEWDNPVWRPWIDELSSRNRLLRYDERGNGMSDWDIPELSFDLLVDDLEAVVDAAGLERFDLLAVSQGSPVAIAFAVRFPERVRKMVLVNGFSVGWRHSKDPDLVESWEAMSTLARTGWGKSSSTFRQIFTSQFFPDATRDQADWWNELQKKSASAENAHRFIEMFGEINVARLLPEVGVPTLIFHCRDDQLVPFEAGRAMAARIPGAQFVALDSRNHLPLAGEPAWDKLKQELRRFLRD